MPRHCNGIAGDLGLLQEAWQEEDLPTKERSEGKGKRNSKGEVSFKRAGIPPNVCKSSAFFVGFFRLAHQGRLDLIGKATLC